MKFLKAILWIILIALIVAIGIVALFVFGISSQNTQQSAPSDEVLYAAPCGASVRLSITPNWLEGDALSFNFYYKEQILSPNIIPSEPVSLDTDTPIEIRTISNSGQFEVLVLARNISKQDFETAADCISQNLPEFNAALASLGSKLPAKDRNSYTPYAIKSMVYVP